MIRICRRTTLKVDDGPGTDVSNVVCSRGIETVNARMNGKDLQTPVARDIVLDYEEENS
jgi:hypothetical protein